MIQRVRRRLWVRFLRALGRDEPAWEVALSFAVGVGISFSPFLGLHTLIALLVAWIFRLNKVDTVIGTLVFVNPWTMVPIYSTATALGWLLLGHDASALPPIPWRELGSIAGWRQVDISTFRPYFTSYVLGSAIFSIIAGALSYGTIVALLLRFREQRRERRLRRMERRRRGHETPAA